MTLEASMPRRKSFGMFSTLFTKRVEDAILESSREVKLEEEAPVEEAGLDEAPDCWQEPKRLRLSKGRTNRMSFCFINFSLYPYLIKNGIGWRKALQSDPSFFSP